MTFLEFNTIDDLVKISKEHESLVVFINPSDRSFVEFSLKNIAKFGLTSPNADSEKGDLWEDEPEFLVYYGQAVHLTDEGGGFGEGGVFTDDLTRVWRSVTLEQVVDFCKSEMVAEDNVTGVAVPVTLNDRNVKDLGLLRLSR